MRTCIVADNQYVTSEGIAAILKRMGADAIYRVRNVKELQDKLNVCPDAMVVLDYTLFDFVSVQQMLNLIYASKQSAWLLFSEELGEQFLRYTLMTEPLMSIVMKHDSQKEIENALKHILNNMPYVCDSARMILNDVPPTANKDKVDLTATEKVVLHEIALGKTTKEIAYEKNLSFHTVNTHRKNIFRKLEINNMHEAIKYAIRAGIIDVAEYNI